MTADRPSQANESEVTVAQAATLPNVAEAFVQDLLAMKEIAPETTPDGTRVLAASPMAYRQRDDTQRRAVAEELCGWARGLTWRSCRPTPGRPTRRQILPSNSNRT